MDIRAPRLSPVHARTRPDGPGDHDVVSVSATAAASAPAVRVWAVLVDETEQWWSSPYLDDGEAVTIDARLGGEVRVVRPDAGAPEDRSPDDGSSDDGHDAAVAGPILGSVRAFDPPQRLEIGAALLPGAYAGTVTFTLTGTTFGTEIRVHQTVRGRIDEAVVERATAGWSVLLDRLAAAADRA